MKRKPRSFMQYGAERPSKRQVAALAQLYKRHATKAIDEAVPAADKPKTFYEELEEQWLADDGPETMPQGPRTKKHPD